jgi:hypothetical protein
VRTSEWSKQRGRQQKWRGGDKLLVRHSLWVYWTVGTPTTHETQQTRRVQEQCKSITNEAAAAYYPYVGFHLMKSIIVTRSSKKVVLSPVLRKLSFRQQSSVCCNTHKVAFFLLKSGRSQLSKLLAEGYWQRMSFS